MATKLDTFPTKVRKSKYPFAEWLNGEIWALTEGEDFKVAPASFRGALYAAKTRLNVEIETTASENDKGKTVFVVRATGPATAKPAKPAAKKTAPAKKAVAASAK